MPRYVTRADGGRTQLRDMFSGMDMVPSPLGDFGAWTAAGRSVSPGRAMSLPAALAAVRLLSETVGVLPMQVLKETGTGCEPATDSPQWELLHSRPNERQSSFDFYAFIMASLQGYGGALLLKAKDPRTGRVMALYPLPPSRWQVVADQDTGDIAFQVYSPGESSHQTITRRDAIYVPGVLLDNPYVGVSPIAVHANAIGMALGTEEYAGRFFENDATPGGVINLPVTADSTQAREMHEMWQDSHRGPRRAHKTAVLFGGATYQTIGVNARDAQIVEAQGWNVEQVARCFRVPASMLGVQDAAAAQLTSEQRNQEFLTFSLSPWLARIEQALHADDDLFPDKTLEPEFDPDRLLRADTAGRTEGYLKARQAGWMSVNDIRAKENMPPIDGGDLYQETPVGGAPQLQPQPQPQETP